MAGRIFCVTAGWFFCGMADDIRVMAGEGRPPTTFLRAMQ
jgi:hypothetical protein